MWQHSHFQHLTARHLARCFKFCFMYRGGPHCLPVLPLTQTPPSPLLFLNTRFPPNCCVKHGHLPFRSLHRDINSRLRSAFGQVRPPPPPLLCKISAYSPAHSSLSIVIQQIDLGTRRGRAYHRHW